MKPLLIEIGSEEIPARFISKGLSLLRTGLTELFEKSSIDFEGIREYATPRRLSLHVSGVAEQQKDKTIEALGPPAKVAFDANGNPTKAAMGFARSLNLDITALKVKQTERGEYVAATVEEKGKSAKDILALALPELISSFQIPKSMRWGESTLRYFRPIHWVLAVMENEVIPFELDGIKSSNITYGHRFLSPAAITVTDPSSYLDLLRQNNVIADPAERKKTIIEGIRSFESSSGSRIHRDDELLDTVTNLVEYPTIVAGSFDTKFIALPRELLITVMRSHQKYFSLEDNEGNMVPSFLVVSNTKTENSDMVRRGAERVLRARLEDAQFYFNEDRKRPFEEYAEELKKVTFQEQLGSIYRKAGRIASLSSFLSKALHSDRGDALQRAAMLCKADLVTGVVREFPELQGYMGMIYALNSGEDGEIASAIHEHYLPRFAGDMLPPAEFSSVLSIADKMDSIASFFSLGKIPTGSEDPFALRRQAIGVISILQNSNINIPLETLVEKSLESLVDSPVERSTTSESILQFFRQRLEGIFLSQEHPHDIVSAVLASAALSMRDVTHRIETLAAMKNDDRFPSLLRAAKRVCNILSRVSPGTVREDLLTESSEKALYSAVKEVMNRLASPDYTALFTLEQPVNRFFEEVLVMDKNLDVRNNRLALLSSVKEAFDSLGDFSKIIE